MLIRFVCTLFLLSLLTSCSSVSQQNDLVLRGTIHWQGEVRVHGDLVLEAGSKLIIAPGTQVVFEDPRAGEDLYQEHPNFIGSELIVRGRLLARGTAAQPIVFRSYNSQGKAGSWGGINIEASSGVLFSYCRFEQADSAIHSRKSMVIVKNSTFRNNLVGLRFHDSDLLAENNLFEENGTAIRFHFGSPVIRNNEIRHNQKGLFISEHPQDYLIENNNFIDNLSYQVSLGEGVRQAVDLRNNYWSEGTSAELEAHFFDGRVDDWLGKIEYQPRRLDPVVLEF
ncbi:MAG: right-handed parallel beta-helix repeat-containing protein [Geopsychrobacter sp.]|nr:right-handed parallel beta-helix repeat-containing protein [Geopsychrobacter sp.]